MSPNPNRKSLLQRIQHQIATQKETEDPRRGRLFRSLETRTDACWDADLLFTDGVSDEIESLNQTSVAFATALTTHRIAEGEEALDLVQFAKDLSTAGVKYFGAAWCSFCTQQAQLFEDGSEFLPFIEVTNPDQTLNSVGTSENIETFPTWEFPDGTRATGVQTLETLSQRSGVMSTGQRPFIRQCWQSDRSYGLTAPRTDQRLFTDRRASDDYRFVS